MAIRLANCTKWSPFERLSGKVAQFEGVGDE
jgi:hypothetical protein